MENMFEFDYLPLLVKSKIFREYLPAFFKVRTLSRVAELTDLLEDSASWLMDLNNQSLALLRLVARLEPGFYLSRDDSSWWNDGFWVEVDEQENLLKFVHFQITGSTNPLFLGHNSVFEEGESLCSAIQFLELFLNQYERYLPTEVNVYTHSSMGMYIVNTRKRSVYWTDEKVYQFQDDTLQLPTSPGQFVTLTLEGNFAKESCRSEDGRKKRRMSLSKILCIHMKRWLFDGGEINRLRSNFTLEMQVNEEMSKVCIAIDEQCQKVWSLFPTWNFAKKMDC